jgi:NAD(P)-dependent dehydrogenase (short-subunit alcohol dehydrogenase family)
VELRGANALITGVAGGLGVHIANALSQEGCSLVVTDLPGDALEARASELSSSGARVIAFGADLRDPDELSGLVARAEDASGPIDVLVNNAGVELTAPFVEYTEAEIDTVMDVNLLAPMSLIRQAVPGMIERGRGHVVTMASLAGRISPAYMSTYGLTKAALLALTQSLRAEHIDDPVGFSAICPGFIRGAGMVEPLVEAGTEFTSTVPLTPPELVGAAVVKAVRKDLPDVTFVHRRPIRAVLAMYAIAPRLTERLLIRGGTPHIFRATTRARGRI